MESFKKQIVTIKQQFEHALEQATTESALEQVRIYYLGRQGVLATLIDTFKELSVSEKRLIGPLLNDLKTFAHQTYETKKEQLQHAVTKQEKQKTQTFDVTAYRYRPISGGLHIYTQLIEHIENIFISMGYDIVDGPEVETDYYNFQALNIPEEHPARELHDTFWLHIPHLLLRTHTSSVQAHGMETKRAPLAICAPGRVYRNEEIDVTHDIMFTQTEGLVIDKNISMAHLIATARTFLQSLFETKTLSIRVRPGYFPFVEPGIEIDASCPFCTTVCSICKKTGWIELLGAGLVHPNVLRTSGINPLEYSGFAFGFGIERIAMIKCSIDDIRLFHNPNMHFLEQF